MQSESKTADLLYGRKPVQLFLEKSPRRALRLWIDRRLDPQIMEKFSRLARGRTVKITPVDPGQIDRLARHAVHQGVALEAEPLRLHDMSDLLGFLKKSEIQNPKSAIAFLALDGVTDPQNFGAICRSAECFGMSGVIFEARHSPPLGGAAYKASAGALDFLTLYAVSNLAEAIRAIRSKSTVIVGLDAGAKSSLDGILKSQRTLPDRLGLVLGSEGRGIRPQIKSICDFLCSIPMAGQVGSLNVSAAAAAVSFWWSSQKLDTRPNLRQN